MRFVSSIANFKRSLPNFERCDRPNDAVGKFDIEYPGCFLHGPDENSGFAGCCNCCNIVVLYYVVNVFVGDIMCIDMM